MISRVASGTSCASTTLCKAFPRLSKSCTTTSAIFHSSRIVVHPESLASNNQHRHVRDLERRKGSRALTCQASSRDAETDWGLEISTLVIRVTAGVLMIHNGLDKLQDPEGFAKFVVEPYLGFLPMPILWTYAAAAAELVGAAGLTLGLFTQLSSLSLFSTMGLAVYFHIAQSGLEGFPLAVVEKHQYAYEPALLYCLIYLYFLVNGGGLLSVDALLKGNSDKN